MNHPPEPVDPTDVAAINRRARSWAAEGETVLPIAIDRLLIQDDGIDALADVARTRASGGRVLMVVDRTVMTRGGEDLKRLVEAKLAGTVALDVRRLPDDPAEPFHADLAAARSLSDALPGYALVVSVGSGSVTDVVKYARHLAVERTSAALPFVCFPTAPSVTAYTSALAVLTVDGVKRTLPARPPEVVVCDLPTLTDAPPAMTRAGFGDVLARSVAYGDWYLAGQLGMDDGFSHLPARLLAAAEQTMIRRAEHVRDAEPDGVRAVTEAVLLAGMAMSLVNQTAPISGWEHVISHHLDLTAAGDGRPLALHGGQVGTATLVAARAYEQAWAGLDLDRITADSSDRDVADRRARIEQAFTRYDATGGLVPEIWRDYHAKLERWRAARDLRQRFAERKRAGELDPFIQANVRSVSEIDDALRRAGGPRRFEDLDQPIPPDAAHAAIRHAHLIRARFTLGDLLDQTGWLTASNAAGLLSGRS